MAKREEIQNQIKEKIVERQQLRDDFTAEKKKFQEQLAEQRKVRQEKYAEEKKQYAEARKIRDMERKVEELDNQPYVSEITLIEQTIKFCKSLMPSDAAAKAKDEVKEIAHNNKANEEVLIKKEDREEFYFAPTKKGKAAKKA